jgi:hypothetical protein
LGARPQIEKFCQQFSQELCKGLEQQTVPKENWPLRPNDIVYPLVYTFNSEDDKINYSPLVEYPPMQIEAGENLKPKHVYYNGTYDIQFRVCDYSNNCLNTRWFHFNDTAQAQPAIMDLGGLNISACREDNLLKNFSIYRNPLYKFNIQYPSDWQKIENAYTDNFIVNFQAPGFDEDGYPSAQILIMAGYFPGTYKEFIDENTPSTMYDPFLKVISINSTNLGGYPAYEQVTNNGKKQTMDIDALIGHTWYTVTYASDPSKFSSYLPYVKKLIDSFQLCRGTELIKSTQNGNITYEVNNNNSREARQFTNRTDNISNFSTYTNPFFKIRYPSDWKIVEDNKQRNVILHSPVAIMSNSSSSWYRTESIVKFSITEVGNASLLYERGVSLEGFANILLSDTRESSTGFNLYESKPIILNGNQGYKITYSYFDSNYKTAWKDTTIITIINDKVYFLEYSGDSSRYEYYLPILENMLDSFGTNLSQPAAR